MTEEEWRPVAEPDFEDLYEASSWGRLRRKATGYILKPCKHPRGYRLAIFSGRGIRRTILIHRVVLMTFAGLPGLDQETRHLNGDRTDNRLENLAWGTSVENEVDKKHHGTVLNGAKNPMTKLEEQQVREIIRRYANGESQRTLAAAYGVAQPQISRIVTKKRWQHLPD
jgi:hypothetical protein